MLASSDPQGVASVIRLSQASYRKMVQNLAWAASYNIVALNAQLLRRVQLKPASPETGREA